MCNDSTQKWLTGIIGLAERFIASPWAWWSQVHPLSSVHDANYPLVCSSWYSTLERDGERRGEEGTEREGGRRTEGEQRGELYTTCTII